MFWIRLYYKKVLIDIGKMWIFVFFDVEKVPLENVIRFP